MKERFLTSQLFPQFCHQGTEVGGGGGTSCRTVVVHLGAVLIVLLCSVFLFLPFFMFPHESLMCSQEHNQVSLLGIFAMMYSSGEVQRRICNT